MRFLKIAYENLKNLTFHDFMLLVKSSLFRNDPMIIYLLETSHVEIITDNALGKTIIRKGNIEELEEVSNHFERIPWEFLCHRYDNVKDFFIASNGNNIQHISWIYYQNDPNRFIRLGPSDAEVKYVLTLPPFRGQRIYPKVLKIIAGYLKQKRFSRVYSFVYEDNYPAIHSMENASFKRIGKIRLRKVFGIQVSRRYIPPEI